MFTILPIEWFVNLKLKYSCAHLSGMVVWQSGGAGPWEFLVRTSRGHSRARCHVQKQKEVKPLSQAEHPTVTALSLFFHDLEQSAKKEEVRKVLSKVSALKSESSLGVSCVAWGSMGWMVARSLQGTASRYFAFQISVSIKDSSEVGRNPALRKVRTLHVLRAPESAFCYMHPNTDSPDTSGESPFYSCPPLELWFLSWTATVSPHHHRHLWFNLTHISALLKREGCWRETSRRALPL